MSTTTHCRREEIATCQPDKNIIVGTKAKEPTSASDCAEMTEKQFMRDHSLYSAMSSWLFAIAGATNIGVLGMLSSKALTAAEQGRPLFKSDDPKVIPVMSNKKYNRVAAGMMVFGGACMVVSNWLESKKVLFEWRLGAGKLQRKANIADKEHAPSTPVADTTTDNTDALPHTNKKWVHSIQNKNTVPLEVGG